MRERFGLSWFVILALLVALVVVILELIPVNYYVLRPGQALSVAPMISIKGHPPVKTRGSLYLTDVYLSPVQHKLEELFWRLDPNAEIDPAQAVSGGLPNNLFLAVNQDMMRDSEEAAEAAALSVATGYRPTFATRGPQVEVVMPGVPAARVLRSGDVIEVANGHRLHHAADLAPIVHRTKPGRAVHLTVDRHGHLLHLSVKTVPSSKGIPNKHGKTALIGVYVGQPLKLPVKIRINSGGIGGPSAGMMFALGIIQRLEHRDLTHGCKVAGTGTIDLAGTVGAIGGARQKIVAARGIGARYFLVPDNPQNVSDAMAGRGSVIVKPVKTLRQALAYLRTIRPCK